MFKLSGFKGCAVAVALGVFGAGLTEARATIYNLQYQVTVTSTTDWSGAIAASSVAVGDKFNISFQLNDTALMSSKEAIGYGSAMFFNSLAGLQVTADAGNSGSWTPSWGPYTSNVQVAGNEFGGTDFTFSFQPFSTNSVANGATGDPAYLTSFNVMMSTAAPFNTSYEVGSPLSVYYPPAAALTARDPGSFFRFETGSGGPLAFTGDAAAVPEPSTWALLGLGAGAMWLLRRRKA